MRAIFTALMLTCVCYLSSCSSNDNNNTVTLPTAADSTTNTSYMQLSFAGKTFTVRDLKVRHQPIHSLFADVMASDVNDTLFIGQLQLTDHESKILNVNMTIYNNSSMSSVGTYYVTTNTSTVTDFTEGANKTYAVGVGSTVEITNTSISVDGTMNLDLYFNYNHYPATGTFTIYH